MRWLTSVTKPDDDPAVKEELRRLDGMLPETVDRRSFFKGAMALSAAGWLAGCTGGGGGGTGGGSGSGSGGGGQQQPQGSGSGGSDLIQMTASFQTSWKAVPTLGSPYVAEGRGHWLDAGITPPNVLPGGGASVAKLVGLGEREAGFESMGNIVAGTAKDFDLVSFGTDRVRSTWCLMYRKDRISDPTTDLEGKAISAGQDAALIWKIYLEHAANGNGPDENELEFARELSRPALLEQGEVDGVWATINDFPAVQANTSMDIGVSPLYKFFPILGYTLLANGQFLSENMEYVVRLHTGFSSAQKWLFTHPEEYIDFMRSDINPSLQAEDKGTHLDALKAGLMATNLTPDIQENGMAYLPIQKYEDSWSELESALGVDAVPVEEAYTEEVQNQAELSTLSSDEWNQAVEFTQPYNQYFN